VVSVPDAPHRSLGGSTERTGRAARRGDNLRSAAHASEESPVKKLVRLAVLCTLTVAPFLPGALEFATRGLPDLAFAGDAAALELGTWHAARGRQLLGAYSRFGWNHPGPAFFYLAAPLYEAAGERGPALNLFTFGAQLICAAAIVWAADRLGGRLLAAIVAAVLSVFELVALPFLLGNEWNPIFPILPLVVLCFVGALIARGAATLLPLFALVASVIVQTHVGYALGVVVLGVYVAIKSASGSRTRLASRSVIVPTLAVLLACWALPLVEAWVSPISNLRLLIEFFVPTPRHLAQQPWSATIVAFARQAAALPEALAAAILHRALPAQADSTALAICVTELFAVAMIRRQLSCDRWRHIAVLAELTLLLAGAAIMSIRSIRGELLFYLVTWCAVCGLLSIVVISAFAAEWLRERIGSDRAISMAMAAGAILVALALAAPVARGSVIGAANADVSRIGPLVDAFLRSRSGEVPTIHIAAHDTWPVAAGVALYLVKRGTPVAVDDAWLNVVGRSLRERPGPHTRIVFADDATVDALGRRGLIGVASSDGVRVLFEPARLDRQ